MEEGIDRTYLENFLSHHTTKERGHGVKHTAGSESELTKDVRAFLLELLGRNLCRREGGRERGRSVRNV